MAGKKRAEEFLPEDLQPVVEETLGDTEILGDTESLEEEMLSQDLSKTGDKTIQYTGNNPSFTIGRVRFTKGDQVILKADLAQLALKNSGFSEVVGSRLV